MPEENHLLLRAACVLAQAAARNERLAYEARESFRLCVEEQAQASRGFMPPPGTITYAEWIAVVERLRSACIRYIDRPANQEQIEADARALGLEVEPAGDWIEHYNDIDAARACLDGYAHAINGAINRANNSRAATIVTGNPVIIAPAPPEPPAPPEVLEFLPGAFIYRGIRRPLPAKPLQVLEALYRAHYKTKSLSDLREEFWETTVTEDTVRSAVSEARQALQSAMSAAGVEEPKNPILNVARGMGLTAWRLLDLP
jgi:hypothetical protein